MATDLTTEFFEGFEKGGDVFSEGNPYIPTSSNHMAFEAGRMIKNCYYKEELKAAFQSRGFTIRVEFKDKRRATFVQIDYDNKSTYIV